MSCQELLGSVSNSSHSNVLFASAESRQLVVEIQLYIKLFHFLQYVVEQVESSPSSPSSRLHLLLPLFARLEEGHANKGMKLSGTG